ncbi:sodium/hydrogen exchanger family protein, partial [Vibrio harveyi]
LTSDLSAIENIILGLLRS